MNNKSLTILLFFCLVFCNSCSNVKNTEDKETESDNVSAKLQIEDYVRMINENQDIPDDAIPGLIEYAYSATPGYIELYEKMLDAIDDYCMEKFGEKHLIKSYGQESEQDMWNLAQTKALINYINKDYGSVITWLQNLTWHLDDIKIKDSDKKKISDLFKGENGTYTKGVAWLRNSDAPDMTTFIYDKMSIRRFGYVKEYPY